MPESHLRLARRQQRPQESQAQQIAESGSSRTSRERTRRWGRVVGALTEGIDIIVVRDPVCSAADARRVASRVKAQGAVLIAHGNLSGFPVDAQFTARTNSWSFGACATERTVRVTAEGRRMPGARGVTVLLPSAAGGVASV